jgi:hypothetical protein
MLRQDGLLVAPERPEPAPPSAPKVDRLAELERRIDLLEKLVAAPHRGA